jgi:TatA/E family protein of Tat protein translocase
MFGSLGLPEIILIFFVALIVFGPKRLPEIGRTIGKALGEFKKATDDFKNTIEREVRVDELKQLSATQVPLAETVSRSEPVVEPAHPAEMKPAEVKIAEPLPEQSVTRVD